MKLPELPERECEKMAGGSLPPEGGGEEAPRGGGGVGGREGRLSSSSRWLLPKVDLDSRAHQRQMAFAVSGAFLRLRHRY